MSQLGLFDSCVPKPPKAKKGGTRLTLFIDGASRKNPGLAGAGVYLLKHDTPILKKGFFLGIKTNNQAEYLALLLGIYYAKKHMQDVDVLFIMSDSELLIRQMKGEYRVKNPALKDLYTVGQEMLTDVRYTLCHVRREKNEDADALANEGIDKRGKVPQLFSSFLVRYGITL